MSALGLLRYWERCMGENSPCRSVIPVILTLVVQLNLKAHLTRVIRETVRAKASA